MNIVREQNMAINIYNKRLFYLVYLTAFIHSTHVTQTRSHGLPLYLHSGTVPDRIPLYYWKERFINFGDYLSLKLLERMVNGPVEVYEKQHHAKERKLLAIGSILTFAATGDIIWGSGANGNWLKLEYYKFTDLTIKAVRGPLTRYFLMHNFNIECPEIYGDPALLIPYFFPELKRKKSPSYDYLIIPHYSEQVLFPKELYKNNIVYPTDPWEKVIEKILDSKLVIAGSLHGIIVAEAFGIPARLLRITENEHIFKFMDYYLGTGRPEFQAAHSVGEALKMGGEAPVQCDLFKLYQAFPFECWPDINFLVPNFTQNKGERT
jgi:pyruvyltransferase